jgi:hypothetical protein
MFKRFAVIGALLACACLPATNSVALRSDARLSGGTETTAEITVPGSWHRSLRGTELAEVTAPDNFSQVIFSLTPSALRGPACTQVAHKVVGEGIPGVRDREVKPTPGHTDSLDYHLFVPGPVPGPSDRVVVGRVICRDGGLVNLSCSTGKMKTETQEACEKVLASLSFKHIKPPVEAPPPVENPVERGPVVPGADTAPPPPPAPPLPPGEVH